LNSEINVNIPLVVVSDLYLEVFELYLLVFPDPPHLIQVLQQVLLAAEERSLVLVVSRLRFARGTLQQHLVSLQHVTGYCYWLLLLRGLFKG
jgi:hypothetical protein